MNTIRLALLTDIHANLAALEAVLAALEREPGLQHIYCLGDLIGIGTDTNEVLEILFARADFTSVRGNHEEGVLALVEGKPPASPPGLEEHHRWVADQLDRRYVPKLAALPRSLAVEHGGVRLFLAHYHLDAEQRFLPIDPQPTAEKLDTHYQGHPAQVVCTGHHHDGHWVISTARVYVNPGALGCGPRPVARYGLITITEHGVGIDRREVPYANRAFLDSYERRQVPGREFILERFHGNQHRRL
jgi:predicted phosphodiesterase